MTTEHYTIGRINFGPRDSFTTLGQLIDEIGAQEDLVDDLCLLAGELITAVLDATEDTKPAGWLDWILGPFRRTKNALLRTFTSYEL